MNQIRMVFRQQPWSGVPGLEIQGIRVKPAEKEILEKEIGQMFDRLIYAGNGAVFNLDSKVSASGWPGRFQITVKDQGNSRCPEIVFEPISEDSEAGRLPRMGTTWQPGFRAEVMGLLNHDNLNQMCPEDRLAIRFVLEELCDLAGKHAPDLLPLLLAGYLALGERMCLAENAEKVGLYVLAARGLDRLFPAMLPAPLTPNAMGEVPASPNRKHAINLRSAASFLGRLLGINGNAIE